MFKKLIGYLGTILNNERGSFDVSNPSTTSSSSASALSTYYVRVFLNRLQAATHFHRFGKITPLPKGEGKTVKWTRFTNYAVATADLTEGITPVATWLTAANVNATVTQFGQYTPLSDMLLWTGIDGILEETAAILGFAGAQGVDYRLRNTLSSPAQAIIEGGEHAGSNLNLSVWWDGIQGGLSMLFYSSSGVNFNTSTQVYSHFSNSKIATFPTDWAMTVWRIRKAVAKLRSSAVPTFEDGFYRVIMTPAQAEQIQKDPEWQEMQQFTGRKNLERGELGDIAGARIFIEQESVTTGLGSGIRVGVTYFLSTGASAITGIPHSMSFALIVGKECYGVTGFDLMNKGDRWKPQIIIKKPGPTSTNDPLNQVTAVVGYKVSFARALLEAKRGYWLVTMKEEGT